MKFIAFVIALLLPFLALGQAKVNQPAPAFTGKDMTGKAVSLNDLKGKTVVLEWYNRDCPYVKKHYSSNNMQNLQKELTGKGVIWVTVISSAPGKQGHFTAQQAIDNAKASASAATYTLLDEDGKIGKAYEAKTTPHMYVINPQGVLTYNGAIDDNDSANPKVIPTSKNYVRAAVESTLAGKPVAEASTKPYGCSVKY